MRVRVMDLQLFGKTALVTGASMGIGRAIAKGLAAEGVQVAAVARRTQLLAELGSEIERGQGPRPFLITQDIMAADAATKLHDAALAGLGRVDILVNCAGGSRPLPLDAPEEKWEEAITLNFTRQRQITHALAPASPSPTGSTPPFRKGRGPRLGQRTVARCRQTWDHGQLDPSRAHHERADPPQLSRRVPREPRRSRDPGRRLRRARGPRCAGGIFGLATRALHQRRRHSGGWWAAALCLLSRLVSLLPLGYASRSPSEKPRKARAVSEIRPRSAELIALRFPQAPTPRFGHPL